MLFGTMSESFRRIARTVFELLALVWGWGWEWRGCCAQGIYNNRYTYQSCWNVFLRGKSGGGQQPTDLSEFQSLLICNGV